MTTADRYLTEAPSRADIDALPGATLLEFGTDWCGHCRAAQAVVSEALALHPGVRHLRVEDGRGRPLGRSFGVKLWPTLVFLEGGRELDKLVRPQDVQSVARALQRIDPVA
jgi:thioredoxin 1